MLRRLKHRQHDTCAAELIRLLTPCPHPCPPCRFPGQYATVQGAVRRGTERLNGFSAFSLRTSYSRQITTILCHTFWTTILPDAKRCIWYLRSMAAIDSVAKKTQSSTSTPTGQDVLQSGEVTRHKAPPPPRLIHWASISDDELARLRSRLLPKDDVGVLYGAPTSFFFNRTSSNCRFGCLCQLIFAAVARLYTASPRQRDWRYKQWGIAAVVCNRTSMLPIRPHFIRLYHHKVRYHDMCPLTV